MSPTDNPLAMRVAAIPGRHRGGLLESWEAYAAWLEQKVAELQEHHDTHVGTTFFTESVYRALPRSRQRLAQRATTKEQRRT